MNWRKVWAHMSVCPEAATALHESASVHRSSLYVRSVDVRQCALNQLSDNLEHKH